MSRIRYHESALLVWALANSETLRSKSNQIFPVHLFSASLRILDRLYEQDAATSGIEIKDAESIAEISANCISLLDLRDDQITALRREIRATYLVIDGVYPDRLLHRSSETKEIFRRAATRAVNEGLNYITLYHLLLSTLERPSQEILMSFRSLGMDLPKVPALESVELLEIENVQLEQPIGAGRSSKTPILDRLGRDLTALAKSGRLSPIVGRDNEIKKVARHLLRTSKRNVLLLGGAGTGKTAIVEGLAIRLASEKAPVELELMRIIEVSITSIVAGTRYRGDMEDRLSRIINEAESDPNIVLFLDEIHLAIGAGSGGEGIDIAGILKPVLSRDDIRCIGATTYEDFERDIKHEKAFIRRFQIVRVNEPTSDEAIEICKQWARRIEEIHHVHFDDRAIHSAVELSHELIRDRFLPDKAIDLLENAATFVKLSTLTFKSKKPQKEPDVITEEEIRFVLEEHLGIGVAYEKFFNPERIEAELRKRLVGQGRAIGEISKQLSILRDHPTSANRPYAIFLFIGPTGVGKTYSAEIIAQAPSKGDEINLLGRFNMNEYKERHELSRLIGAPPGFIGHDQYGSLFRFADENPQGVILLDEVEKAHPEILDYFMQIFDKGESRDSQGNLVDFRRHIFIMTCNQAVMADHRRIGFPIGDQGDSVSDRAMMQHLETIFRKDFLARIDQIVLFEELTLQDFIEMFGRHLEQLQDLLKTRFESTLEVDQIVRSELAEMAIERGEGARGFIRIFNQSLVTEIMEKLENKQGKRVIVSWDGGVKLKLV